MCGEAIDSSKIVRNVCQSCKKLAATCVSGASPHVNVDGVQAVPTIYREGVMEHVHLQSAVLVFIVSVVDYRWHGDPGRQLF